MTPIVVNLFGGPGTGKSTTAAATFAELKRHGINAELVTEYAKELVWSRSQHMLSNQIYIFGKQYHRMWKLMQDVDVIVTDCPLLLSMYYGREQSVHFRNLALETFRSFDNLSVFLTREKAFNPRGRTQDEGQAREIDGAVKRLLVEHAIPHVTLPASRLAPAAVTALVLNKINNVDGPIL